MKHTTIDLIWTKAQIAAAALGGWLGHFLGGTDGLLTALAVFTGLDYLSGVLCALAERRLSSAVGFRGVCRKALIFAMVGVGHLLDTRVAGTGAAIRTAIICFYLSNEGLSLLENAARLGLPVPERLKTALSQLHGKSGEENP